MVERGADDRFAHGVTGALDVGRFAQQKFDPFPADLRNARKIDRFARDGRQVDLKVAAVEDLAVGRVDAQRHRTRDGVVDVDKFHRKAAELDFIARFYGVHLHLVEPMLAQLVVGESQREFGAVDGHVDLFEKVRDAADVVFMPVRDQKSAHLVLVGDEIADVGNDEVDAGQLLVGEGETRIDDDDVVSVLDGGHVLADFADAAEEDDLYGIFAPAALFEFLLFALLVRIRAVVSLLRGNKCLRAAAGIRRPAYLCALPLTLLRLRLLLRGVLCVAEKERHLRPAGLLPALFLCKCPVVLFLLQNILLFFGARLRGASANRGLNDFHSTPAVRLCGRTARPCFIVPYPADQYRGAASPESGRIPFVAPLIGDLPRAEIPTHGEYRTPAGRTGHKPAKRTRRTRENFCFILPFRRQSFRRVDPRSPWRANRDSRPYGYCA